MAFDSVVALLMQFWRLVQCSCFCCYGTVAIIRTERFELHNINKLAKFSHNPGIIHFRALIHLIGFIKTTSYKGLKYYSDYTSSPVYKLLTSNNIKTTEESIITFTDLLWDDCTDIGRITGGYISFG